jgi:L-methionine (R)-S-oxide reductase
MTERQIQFLNLLNEISAIAEGPSSADGKLAEVCNLLKKQVDTYNWVGFYLVDPKKSRELILGPYAGEPTIHTRIPFGRGICGQAADTEKIFIVDDVAAESNYLSCSINVKSEIVLPIFKGGVVAGELDIDSHTRAAFDSEDEEFLTKICDIVSRVI